MVIVSKAASSPRKSEGKARFQLKEEGAVVMAKGGRRPFVACWEVPATVLGPLQVFLLGPSI